MFNYYFFILCKLEKQFNFDLNINNHDNYKWIIIFFYKVLISLSVASILLISLKK